MLHSSISVVMESQHITVRCCPGAGVYLGGQEGSFSLPCVNLAPPPLKLPN